jgi:hypothetical protein
MNETGSRQKKAETSTTFNIGRAIISANGGAIIPVA